jgi:DsbC/DsbD-like thiol-disulfide interchange protein
MGNLRLLTMVACLALATPLSAAAPKTKAHLFLSAESARPGETIMAAVELRMPGNWHTYWRNPGDAGQPTQIDWQLPPGLTAGEIQWPAPKKYVTPPLTTYVYHTNAVLLVPLHLSNDVPLGAKEIRATVSWMECDHVCSLGHSAVSARLTVGDRSQPGPGASLISATKKKLPQTGEALSARARWEKPLDGESRQLLIEGQTVTPAAFIDFYPYDSENYEFSGETDLLEAGASKWALRKRIDKLSGDWPRQIKGLIVAGARSSGIAEAYEIELALDGAREGSTGID